VQTINQCFSPSEREIEHAQKVIDAYDEAIRHALRLFIETPEPF